jgi:uncharacterized protein (TIGR02453 family)
MALQDAFQFLEDLKNNNNKEWFYDHKKQYEVFKKEYHALITNLLEEMKKEDPSLKDLEVKNCTFRINRDIRFAKDKSPYKTNLGIWFSTRKNQKNAPGYYVHYEKGKSFIAGGLYCPETEEVKKIRKEIAFFYDDLDEILKDETFKNTFQALDREEQNVLKKAPKDYEPNHPAIEHLKLKSYTATFSIKEADFFDTNFAKKIAKKLLVLKPLNEFLNRALETVE